ncbi:pyridoxal kinase PdxY [Tessaracoccus sp. SD287]|uniref:pyridoxal kinase PdxY n=1 Tax=Tessaracoccus sp. SD287 TaxID=2782008 RepID=UPI001A962C11|nr:pyridoxal kinase PdxY [Tessaracoccus sp. SD287]
MTSILSIQSAVAYGHAGNSSAVFPLQRLGVETWPVYTVMFSNHTGYGAWRGPLIPPADVREVVLGIDERGALAHCDAVLSGYLGAPEVGEVILEAAALTKKRNPNALYCCDPVMGDVGRGFFTRPGVAEFFRDHVIAAADVITPNLFEVEFLTGRSIATMDELLDAVEVLRAMGPHTVLVTSAHFEGESVMRMVAVNDHGAWQVETPLIDQAFVGSGDLTTAVFVARLLSGLPLAEVLALTADSVHGILAATQRSGSSELAIVTAQDELVNPSNRWDATALR